MRRLITRLARFMGLPSGERRLLAVTVMMLVLARLGVTVAGIPRTRRLLASLSLRWGVPPTRLADLVRVACLAVPGATLCLPRAMVLEALLRASDHPAELRIGIAPRVGRERPPAHAWVEVSGVAVAEDPSRYTPLPLFGTGG